MNKQYEKRDNEGVMFQTPIRRVVQPVTALGNNASDNWDDPDYLERAVPAEDIIKEQKELKKKLEAERLQRLELKKGNQ